MYKAKLIEIEIDVPSFFDEAESATDGCNDDKVIEDVELDWEVERVCTHLE